jgi:hypothetical protein
MRMTEDGTPARVSPQELHLTTRITLQTHSGSQLARLSGKGLENRTWFLLGPLCL